MGKKFYKLISLFFLTILLSSNVLNVHAYLHQEENQCITDSCQNSENENEEEAPCDLCLLAISFNNLDYHNTTAFSFENSVPIIEHNREKALIYQELNCDLLALSSNRNKAPPHHI